MENFCRQFLNFTSPLVLLAEVCYGIHTIQKSKKDKGVLPCGKQSFPQGLPVITNPAGDGRGEESEVLYEKTTSERAAASGHAADAAALLDRRLRLR